MKVGIIGALGKWGRALVSEALVDEEIREIELIISPLSEHLGEKCQIFFPKFPAEDFLKSLPESACDIYIDASETAALEKNLTHAVEQKKPLVIGTTGHSENTRRLFEGASEKIPLLYAPNFSIGAYLLEQLSLSAAGVLPKERSIRIEESHHFSKKDRPSGTALKMAQALKIEKESIISHRTETSAITNEVQFRWGDELLTLSHSAGSRRPFAKGALEAAKSLVNKPPGFYTLDTIL